MGVGFALKEADGHNSGQGWPSKAEAERWAEKVRKYDDREITVVQDGKWWRIHYGPELKEDVRPGTKREDPCPRCKKTCGPDCHCGCHDADLDDDYREVEEGFLSPDFECMECGKVFRSKSLEPRCPKCGSYDIDIKVNTLGEAKTIEALCLKCMKTFTAPVPTTDFVKCPKCGRSEQVILQSESVEEPKKRGEKVECGDCGHKWTMKAGDEWRNTCPKCKGTDIDLAEEYPLTTYFTGNDKDGWVLIHQGQPMNANPQNGIPVDRERVQRVAKQFGFKDVMVWNGKNYTYSFGEAYDPKDAKRFECKKCGHVYWGVKLERCPGCNKLMEEYEVKCIQCKKPMNPVQALMGPVCGECTRKNHAAATKGFDKAYTQARGGK